MVVPSPMAARLWFERNDVFPKARRHGRGATGLLVYEDV